jgi:ABC-type multidrug transport system ATPase subunit
MWRLLSKVAQANTCAVVLTTHNMLECEAVCTRVGVMKMGELVCLGDAQHLRSVHGTGFLLEINLSAANKMEECKAVSNDYTLLLRPFNIMLILLYLLVCIPDISRGDYRRRTCMYD